MNIDHIAAEALQLNPHDRAILAGLIWESLEDPYAVPGDMSEQAAIALAKERDRDIESGRVTPLSHDELMARLRGEN